MGLLPLPGGESALQGASLWLKLQGMVKPLALVFYDKLLPGSQVVNRLQDMGYRVQTVADPAGLVKSAEESKPMVVLADLNCTKKDICGALGRLRQNKAPSTCRSSVSAVTTTRKSSRPPRPPG